MKFHFPAIATAFRERQIVRQPIPEVTEKDVARIVRRDFPEEEHEAAIGVLREYAQGELLKECSRVQLAALKLAQGNFRCLRQHIDNAQRDYRDVLAAAEYPEYTRVPISQISHLSRKEKRRIVNSDWEQYSKWLQR